MPAKSCGSNSFVEGFRKYNRTNRYLQEQILQMYKTFPSGKQDYETRCNLHLIG